MRNLWIAFGLWLCLGSAALASEDSYDGGNKLRLIRHGFTESIAIDGGNYRDFTIEGDQASFVIDTSLSGPGEREYEGRRIQHVSWELLPADNSAASQNLPEGYRPARVTLKF